MSDRLEVITLALLLVAPLWLSLDGQIFESAEPDVREPLLPALSAENVKRHAEGLQVGLARQAEALAAN